MNVSLTPELEELVNSNVASGTYRSASDVIERGLRLLNEHDRALDARREELRREIMIGMDAVNRGEFIEYDRDSISGLADQIKAEGRRRRAASKSSSTVAADATSA